jgi:hypothetical protein
VSIATTFGERRTHPLSERRVVAPLAIGGTMSEARNLGISAGDAVARLAKSDDDASFPRDCAS